MGGVTIGNGSCRGRGDGCGYGRSHYKGTFDDTAPSSCCTHIPACSLRVPSPVTLPPPPGGRREGEGEESSLREKGEAGEDCPEEESAMLARWS